MTGNNRQGQDVAHRAGKLAADKNAHHTASTIWLFSSSVHQVSGLMPFSPTTPTTMRFTSRNPEADNAACTGTGTGTAFAVAGMRVHEHKRRAQVGFNKGEAHHALKNALRIGRQGEIRDRTVEDQHYRAAVSRSCPLTATSRTACTPPDTAACVTACPRPDRLEVALTAPARSADRAGKSQGRVSESFVVGGRRQAAAVGGDAKGAVFCADFIQIGVAEHVGVPVFRQAQVQPPQTAALQVVAQGL